MNEKRIVIISHDITDKELSDMIVVLTRRVLNEKKPFWLLIHGYDADPRDLWDIPEVATLCKRLIKSGFISVLECFPHQTEPTAFSSFQVVKLAERKMVDGVIEVRSRSELDDFRTLLNECNAKCETLSDDYSARNEIPKFFQRTT